MGALNECSLLKIKEDTEGEFFKSYVEFGYAMIEWSRHNPDVESAKTYKIQLKLWEQKFLRRGLMNEHHQEHINILKRFCQDVIHPDPDTPPQLG